MALLLTITLRVASSLRVSGGLAVRSGVRRRVGSGVCGVGLRSVEEARSAEAPAPAPAPFSLELDIGTPEQKARRKAILKAERERFVAENGREPTSLEDMFKFVDQVKQRRKPPRGGEP